MAQSTIIMATPEKQPETPRASCRLCGLRFWSKTLLAIHLRNDHNSDEVAMELAKCYVNHK